MLIPVLLAGGGGTRLWPMSRPHLPKPFLPLLRSRGETRSMLGRNLEMSYQIARELNLSRNVAPMVVGAQKQRRLLETHSQNIEHVALLLEPVARSTAASVALAALQATETFPDENPILLVVAADIYVESLARWRQSVENAIVAAQNGFCVVLGIEATSPRPDFAYLRVGERITNEVQVVDEMVLRPHENAARSLIANGAQWSSGLYCIGARTILQELERQAPQILHCCQLSHQNAKREISMQRTVIKLNRAALRNCPSQTLDEAVFRNAKQRAVSHLKGDWNDVGTWRALHELSPHDEKGNSVLTLNRGDVRLQDSRNCLVQASSRTVAVLGMEDVIVVETPDAVLVLPLSRAGEAAQFAAAPHLQVLADEGRRPM